MRFVFACVACLCFVFHGCKRNTATQPANPDETVHYDAAPDPSRTGSITGTVLFRGTPAPRIAIDMSQDPACSIAALPNASEQLVVNKDHLANVFVFVKGAPRLKAPAAAVVIDQHGCRFEPHVAAVAAGGTVEFRNSDPAMHNIHSMAVQAGNRNVDISQAPGAKPDTLRFRDAENMVPVRCNNHPWMNAFLNVAPNTFFAVTAPDGSFSIDGLPAGDYELVFAHEKLGEQHLPVTVKANAGTAITVTYPAH